MQPTQVAVRRSALSAVLAQLMLRIQLTQRRYRIPPKNFFHDARDVWQNLTVLDTWEATGPNDAVNFIPCLFLDLGMEHHGEEKRRHG